jgi:hypothetical protein
MKKKIFGLLTCILLMISIVPLVDSFKYNSINSIVTNAPHTKMTTNWTEMQKLNVLDATSGDYFGYSISIDGNNVLIGNVLDDDNGVDSGSAYIFIRNGTTWTQQAKLLPSDGASWDEFGLSVSLSGDTALIGAWHDDDNGGDSGSAYIFTRNGTTWTQQAKLLPSDGEGGDVFGFSVSLSGDTALIGAVLDNDNGGDSGSAYVFTRSGTIWTQQQKLHASDGASGDVFGYSVSLSGNTALIGAKWDNDYASGSGSAYIFIRNSTTWTQQAKLLASDSSNYDYFGSSVFLNEDTALIGAPQDDDNGVDSGSAYVFTRSNAIWTQQAKLLALDGTEYDQFGISVSLSDNNALIGSVFDDDNGANSGSAYIFTRDDTIWTPQVKLLPLDGAAGDEFGMSVSLERDTAFIGAYRHDDNGQDSGSVYIFKGPNQPPIFGIPVPANSSINNSFNLNWSIPINDSDGDRFSWIIECNNGQIKSETNAINGTKSLTLTELSSLTTYTVWVNATDPNGSGLYTKKWFTFTTANLPPNRPVIDGPSSGKAGVSYIYNFIAVDPDGNDIYYWINWSDGSLFTEWIGPYHSGQLVMVSHTFLKKGTFIIKCQAKDSYDAISDWGTLSVTMPYSYNLPFMQFWLKIFERFPYAFPLLRHLMGY